MDIIEPIPTDRPTDHALRALGPALRRIRGAFGHRAAAARGPSAALVRSIVEEIANGRSGAASWTPSLIRGGDPAVVALRPSGSSPAAILRIAEHAKDGLVAAEHAQRAARAEMGEGAAVVPEVLGSGSTHGHAWLLERALPGEPGRTRMTDAPSRAAAVAAVARAIAPLHGGSAVRPVGAGDVAAWVTDRVRFAADVAGGRPSEGLWASGTEARLTADVRGRSAAIGRIHGDLWLENVRFAPGTNDVTAIVDWDSSTGGELPLQDLVHLAITTRRRAERRDFGPVLVDALAAAPRSISLRWLLADGSSPASHPELDALIAPELDPVTVLLLAWLRFVEVNIGRHPELAADRRWVDANVRRVIAWG